MGISFQNFWQMIVERKVRVVVMITALQERNKRKAEQYWPDSETKVLNIGGGITLEHRSTSYQGTYYHRSGKIILCFFSETFPNIPLPQSDLC